MDRSQIEVTNLQSQGRDGGFVKATPAERIAMVWPLTLEAWAFKDKNIAQSRFQRDQIRVIRGQS